MQVFDKSLLFLNFVHTTIEEHPSPFVNSAHLSNPARNMPNYRQVYKDAIQKTDGLKFMQTD